MPAWRSGWTPNTVCTAAARLHQLSAESGRDLQLSSGIQGERRYLLPQQPVDQLRRGNAGHATAPLRSTARPAPPTSRTSLRSTAPNPTFTARWWQARTPPPSAKPKQLADRHGSMDLLQHQSVHSGHPAHLGRPAGGPLHPPHPDRLHGHPPLPWRRVSHHGGQRRRGSARRQGGYRRRKAICGNVLPLLPPGPR